MPEVVQGVSVGTWELGCGHLRQELPFEVGGHWAGFHQGDAGNGDKGTESGAPAQSRPILLITAPLSFSTPIAPIIVSFLRVPPSPPSPPFPCLPHHCLHPPLLVSTPHPCPAPASQDVELEQLDGQALEESFQGELGGCIDVIEHDT